MKKILLLLIIPIFLAGCSDTVNSKVLLKNDSLLIAKEKETANSPSKYGVSSTIPNYFSVAPELFQELYDIGGMTVIDVRTPREIAEGKIYEEALEIDFNSPDFREKISKLDKTKPYLLYCRSGGRSGNALKMFKKMGFWEAYDLDGGKLAWDKYEPKNNKISPEKLSEFREINISAQRFEFSSTEIRVKQGEKIVLKIDNQDMPHGMNIEELDQRDDEQIILDTSQKGTFEFGCNNLCGIGHNDMRGQIIIE